MIITETTTVADIATALPGSVRVFQRYGIDFCCGGKRPLAAVCREQNLPLADVTSAIESAGAEPRHAGRDWQAEPLDRLIDHILATYHDPLREELPRLEAMAAKVARVHGARAPYLGQLASIVDELSADLRLHMHKEELVLFPAIRAIASPDAPPRVPVSAPIAVMEQEHDRAGAMLAELRTLTGQYAAPDWACGTFRALYHGLAELESEMHVHVHLENNVLFPRALDLAPTA